MAYDYNQIKKQYEWLNDQQKEQFAEMNKNDTTWNYQKFMDQYNKEKNNRQPQNTEKAVDNRTQTPTNPISQQPTDMTAEEYRNSDEYKNSQWKLYEWQIKSEVSPDLDQSKFNEAPWQITVKEWTAAQTGKPDYTISTDARLNEMKGNLDQYFKDSPRMFSDRETFNKVFDYNGRESEAQRQLLDSYWKRKQDIDNASKYTSWDGIESWMKDADITTDQLNYIKENSPEAYREWQQKQQDDINLRIANMATPADPTDTAELFNSLVEKLWLEPNDPYQIYDNWYDMCERLGVFSDSEKLSKYQTQLDQNHSKMESIMSRYANSAWWTVSDALAAARMNKALAPYQQIEANLQNSYTALLNWRNSNLAVANQSAQALAMQAQEDQRVRNQRYQALWFAMTTASYRTPEQQAQLQLQTAQIQNDMNLLQTSKQNDLNLYNQKQLNQLNLEYQAEQYRQQNRLQAELTDLSVTDPAQLRANLNNVLSDYYKNYWDIIKRSQSEVIDDVLAYAKEHGVSVAEALRKNFIEPLQSKQEYKNKIATTYAAPKSDTSVWYSKITINWKDYLTLGWKIIDPATLWIGTGTSEAKPYSIVAPEIMESWIDSFAASVEQWQKYWQCGKFVNDYLVSIWATAADNRYFGNEDVNTRAKRCNQQTASKWAVAVFNYGLTSSDWINHGHVAIVTKTYEDWSFDVVESNYPSWETINKKRHVEANDAACLWFINPSLWASTSQWYNTQDPYSWVSKYTSTWKEINAGGWITSLERSFDRWEKLTDTQRKDLYSAYWVDVSELNEMRERYMDYVETKQMVDSLLDVKERAMKLKEWAEQDTNKNLKGTMDLSIAEKWYANAWENFWSYDDTIESIKEWKALYDNLMSNAWFQKYLDMKNKWAQFWIMTDSEWNKVDNSVAPLKREQGDELFIKNLNSMIKWYDEVLMQLWYDFGEWAKPETADQIEIIPEQWITNSGTITMIINGKKMYSDDWWKTRH